MIQRNLLKASAIAFTMSALSFNLYASGFQINEHSAAGLGRAFAGEGAMDDTAAVASRNAAALMLFNRPSFSIGATYIRPKISVNGTSPYGQNLEANDIAPGAIVPNMHYVQPLNDKFAWGLSLTSNYGLSTEFDDDYPAGSLAGTTRLTTGNLNLNGAYRLNEYVSIGVGANAVYAKAKLTRHLGELNRLPGLGSFPSDTEVAYLKGDKWAYGWNAGLLYEIDENNRFGLSYRSKVDIKFKGDFHNELPIAAGGTNGVTIPGALALNLPDIWEFSAYHRVDPKWAVHYGFTYTGWSTFTHLLGEDDSGKALFYKEEGFKNNIRLALGTTHYYNKAWTFRAGVAFDESAAPNNRRSISIPDRNRVWLSAGTSYKLTPDASIDLGITYMKGQKVKFVEHDKAGQKYEFTSKGKAMMYAMNFNYAF